MILLCYTACVEVTLDGLEAYAAAFVADLPRAAGAQAHIVGLKGDLGAGKTTFVQAVARELGVTEPVTSPTFVFVQVYPVSSHSVFKRLVHIDAYRLSPSEPDTIGLADYAADPQNLILIEWPENVSYMIHTPFWTISFEMVDETTRRIITV